jgi:hypothetical protein
LLAKLSKEVKITVNKEAYDAALNGKTAETIEKYGRKDVKIADVGGVAVPFDTWFGGMVNDLRMPPEMVDEFKQKDPSSFKTFADDRLKSLEDGALLEYDAEHAGIAKSEDFIREVNKYRAGKMVDRLYAEVFLPTIPTLTDDDLKAYYEGHLTDFQDPERADVYVVVIPDKVKAAELQVKVKAGADPGAAVQPYLEEFDAKLRAAGGSPEKSDPVTLPFCQVLTVRKVAPPATPGSPNAEPPLIAELRPRVFATKEGAVSEAFQLKDGRWAFFRYSKYFPMVQHSLDELAVKNQVKDMAYNEKVASPEVDRMCQKWFKDLRAKHKIEINEGALKMAFKQVQKMQ